MLEFATSKITKYLCIMAAATSLVSVMADTNLFSVFTLLGWALAVLLAYANEVREDQVEVLINALEEAGFEVEII